MINLKPTCDKRRKKKDGTHPIVFRITVKGKSRDISTGLYCDEKDWDFKRNSVKGKTEELILLGSRVSDQELELRKKIRDFDREHQFIYDVQDVKNSLCNKRTETYTVKEFWLEEIKRMHKAKKHSNALNYQSALLGIEKANSLNIPFELVTYAWLLDVETNMSSRGLKTNSISVYLRSLRCMYNKAINLNIVSYSYYPFRRYKIKSGRSHPRNLNTEDMKKYFSYEPSSKQLKWAHDIGKLIFLLRGINYTDLALLTLDNRKKDRIVYHRSKTQKVYSVKIEAEVSNILYSYSSVGSYLLLPILTKEESDNKKNLPNLIKQKRKTLNKWLRKIGAELNLDEPLSSYVFRYSHAGICRELGFSKDMISQSLGHQSAGAAVTDRYLNDYDHVLIDSMNRAVIDAVMK